MLYICSAGLLAMEIILKTAFGNTRDIQRNNTSDLVNAAGTTFHSINNDHQFSPTHMIFLESKLKHNRKHI